MASCVGADGVHFSEAAIRRHPLPLGATGGATGRATRGRRRIIVTAAAHSFPALIRAARRGADAALLSPVFPTRSHPGAPALGAVRFAALVHGLRRRGISMRVIALGGVTGTNAARLVHAGASGLAAIGALS
jgi:thiamine-phosphate pyrophosphorylase